VQCETERALGTILPPSSNALVGNISYLPVFQKKLRL
jgi:hypothetical protein